MSYTVSVISTGNRFSGLPWTAAILVARLFARRGLASRIEAA